MWNIQSFQTIHAHLCCTVCSHYSVSTGVQPGNGYVQCEHCEAQVAIYDYRYTTIGSLVLLMSTSEWQSVARTQSEARVHPVTVQPAFGGVGSANTSALT